jgi:excisionase family DNA binding protein
MGEDAGRAGRRGVDGLTVQEAARRLGVSEGAIRKRVARGTIRHDKGHDGRVYVYLDAGVDEGVDPHSNALTSQLREEIAYLREENRRKDEIIMQQAITMRQLTAAAPQEPPTGDAPGGRQEAAEEPGRVEPRPATGGAQEPAQPRSSWWRRWLGG